jgi:hypothetical protein
MKLFTLLCTTLFVFSSLFVSATTYTTIADGDWTSASTWAGGNVPGDIINDDDVTISHQVTYTIEVLRIKGYTNFEIVSGGSLTVNGELRLTGTFYGGFKVKSGSSLHATILNIQSKYTSATLNGTISGTSLNIKDATATVAGTLNFTSVSIRNYSVVTMSQGSALTATDMVVNDSDFYANGTENNGITINLWGKLTLSNYANFDLSYTDFDAYEIDGNGHYSTITGGTFDVGNNMDITNSTYMEFHGTVATIQNTLSQNASSNIVLDDRAQLSGNTIILTNSSNVFGEGEGGILNFQNSTLNSGSCVTCITTEICYYGQGEETPQGLDLKTGASGALLPVELIFFSATERNRGVELQWATASEIDNDYFQLEQSTDGRNWTKIAELSGQGTTNETTHYHYTDNRNYSSKLSYYRLLQVDFDGTSTYSDIQVIEFETASEPDFTADISVYPNPAAEFIMLGNVSDEITPQVLLSNMLGQQVQLTAALSNQGYRLNIPASLPAGNYFLQVKIGEQTTTKKITIE